MTSFAALLYAAYATRYADTPRFCHGCRATAALLILRALPPFYVYARCRHCFRHFTLNNVDHKATSRYYALRYWQRYTRVERYADRP